MFVDGSLASHAHASAIAAPNSHIPRFIAGAA
jgi:hypothetical protein